MKLGLWLDLTKTTRYFDGDVVKKRGCQYEKIWCEGHGCVPDWKQVKTFTEIIDKFISEHPDKIIGVHCTHGYNRTGYLIISYLVNRMNYQIDDALKAFSNGRPPGIYRESYVTELIHRFGGDLSKHFIAKPFWVKKEIINQVELPLRLGQTGVIVPQSDKAIPGKVVCVSGSNESISIEHQSFVQDHTTFRHPDTYEDERRKEASRRRWRDFDRRRREKRHRARDELRDNHGDEFREFNNHYGNPQSSQKRESHSRKSSRPTYQRPSPYHHSSRRT